MLSVNGAADANPDDFDVAYESDDASEEEYINAADASRMGKAVEHLVAAACILSTRGNLNVSTSLVDDEGVDLVFHARDSVRTLAVQVKARMSDSKTVRTKQRFIAMVREATFTPRDDLAMLFVLAEVVEGRYTTAWLVPSKEFASRAQVRSDGKRRFVASVKPDTKDQWVSFRHNAATLPAEVLRILTA